MALPPRNAAPRWHRCCRQMRGFRHVPPAALRSGYITPAPARKYPWRRLAPLARGVGLCPLTRIKAVVRSGKLKGRPIARGLERGGGAIERRLVEVAGDQHHAD